MAITLLIAAAFFAGTLLLLWNGYQGIEAQRRQEQPAAVQVTSAGTVGHCVLCHASLHKPLTGDEAVLALERRIDADMDVVTRFVAQPAPETLTRFYLN